jgi:hypothetical protein
VFFGFDERLESFINSIEGELIGFSILALNIIIIQIIILNGLIVQVIACMWDSIATTPEWFLHTNDIGLICFLVDYLHWKMKSKK